MTYAPKPKTFGGAVEFPVDTYQTTNNMRDILSDVCASLLYVAAGSTCSNKYLGTQVEEMVADPYLVRHRISGFSYSWDASELVNFKKMLGSWGKDRGLWTLHSKEGANLGVAGDTILIRINPEALQFLMDKFFLKEDPDILAISEPGREMPGWRVSHRYTDHSVRLYRMVLAGDLEFTVKEDNLYFRDLRRTEDPYAAYMERLLSEYPFQELRSYVGPAQELFPNVDYSILADGIYSYPLYVKQGEELASAEEELRKRLQDVREKRKVHAALKAVGGWEGLRARMCRDLKESLHSNAVLWAVRESEAHRGWRAEELTRELSEAFLEGLIKFPKEQ